MLRVGFFCKVKQACMHARSSLDKSMYTCVYNQPCMSDMYSTSFTLDVQNCCALPPTMRHCTSGERPHGSILWSWRECPPARLLMRFVTHITLNEQLKAEWCVFCEGAAVVCSQLTRWKRGMTSSITPWPLYCRTCRGHDSDSRGTQLPTYTLGKPQAADQSSSARPYLKPM